MDIVCSCKHTDVEYSRREAFAALDQTRIVCLFVVVPSMLCYPCAVPVWCKSVGNLNLGTLDAVDFMCSMSCSARLSAHPGVIKGSFNICNLLGVFSFFFSFSCLS